MPYCKNCGAFVDAEYASWIRHADGDVEDCLQCPNVERAGANGDPDGRARQARSS